MHARLRPWIHALEGKLNEKDKIRIEKHKQDTDQPMVIKKIDKKGKRTVWLGPKYSWSR